MGSRQSNTEEFIIKAKIKHGELYNYDNVKYVNSCTKVSITCPLHGEFLQTPAHHLHGTRCPSCFGSIKYSFDTLQQAIDRKHSGKIELLPDQNIDGIERKYKFKHVCGHEWEAKAGNILNGKSCPKCGNQIPHTNTSFSELLNKKHNGSITLCENQVIDGMRFKYRFRHICGYEWEAKANNILSGKSCPKCTFGGFNPSKPAVLYILKINGEFKFTGFGISNKYQKRKRQHQNNLRLNNCSIQSEILINSEGETIQSLEQYIKQTLQCNNSHIDGFKTESVLISPIELKDFAVSYLDKMGYSYKLVV